MQIRTMAAIMMIMLAVTLIDASDARAQATDSGRIPQQIDLYDVILTYPQPAWISGNIEADKLLDQSEFYRDHAGSQFLLEQIPRGQEFTSWDSLYAVAAEELADGQTATMRDFIGLAVDQNNLACADGGFGAQTFGESEGDAMLVLVCGSTVNGPPNVGYGPDVGEVSIWRFLIYENTYLKVYQRWRGPALGIDERTSWPVSEPQLQEMRRRLENEIAVLPNNF